MNKNLKVIFNKARGSLMVVNELTKSTASRSSKTVIAAAVIGTLSGSIYAETSPLETVTLDQGWSNENHSITTDEYNKQYYFNGFHQYFNKNVVAQNLTFENNKLQALTETLGASKATDAQGGVMYLASTGSTEHPNTKNSFENVTFKNNSVLTQSNQGNRPAAYGGALLIKGGDTTFKNTTFNGNTAISESDEQNKTDTAKWGGGSAAGGAIFVDSTINTNRYSANINFEVNIDGLVNSGNTVKSGLEKPFTDGYTTKIPTAGGFLYMDRGVTANFNIADNVTYTIGTKDAWKTDKNMDSIASSVYLKNANHDNVVINKTGKGTLLMHGSLNDYYGTVNVNEGTLEVTSDWAVANTVTINNGGKLKIEKISFTNVKTASAYDGTAGSTLDDVVDDHGSVIVKDGGSLETGIGQVFTSGSTDATINSTSVSAIKNGFTFNEGSSLILTDAGSYANSLLTSMQSKANINYIFENATLKIDEVDDSGSAAIKGNVTTSTLEVPADATSVSIEANVTLTGSDTAEGVQNLAGDLESIKIAEGKALTVQPEKTFIQAALPSTDLGKSGTLTVVNADVAMPELSGGETAKVLIGSNDYAGELHLDALSLKGTSIFLDPAWKDGQTIADASFMSVAEVKDASGTIAVGQNSVVALYGTKSDAVSAFTNTGATWSDKAVTAAFYLGKSFDAANAKILVNGALTSEPAKVDAGITIAKQSMLLINQAGVSDVAVENGSVTLEDGSYIGVANASVGAFKISESLTADASKVTVLSDNPFVDAALSSTGGTITGSFNGDYGMTALASTGVQATTFRAAGNFAETIAQRTTKALPENAGVQLWADASGEHYEMDVFRSDMGYGAFGGEVALPDSWTVGAALQYGSGSVRGDLSSVKNDVSSVGFALYGTKSWGAIKAVADFEYLQSSNDITSDKKSKSPFNKKGEHAKETLELIHSDVCGPYPLRHHGYE